MIGIEDIDAALLLTLNGKGVSWLDTVMMTVTNRWFWVPFYVLLVGYMVKTMGWRQAIFWTLCAAAAVGITDFVIASGLRPWIGRLRPSNLDNPLSAFVNVVDGYRGGRYGFPSCHAGNTAALAAVLILTVRKRWLTAVLVAYVVINCYSRMYLGVHYPGDILVGLIIGALVGWGLTLGARRVYPKLLSRFRGAQ